MRPCVEVSRGRTASRAVVSGKCKRMSGDAETKPRSRWADGARDVRRRVEFGDLLMLLYLVALVRQYLWWATASNPLAWSLAFLGGALGWFFYVATKESPPERTPLPFWVVVVLPLVFVYALRVVFPDVSFDVLNYRIFHAERTMRGFLYAPGDFFPSPAPYNPLPDMVTGIGRYALGYRLGTVVNLLAMVWAGAVLDKLLRPYLKGAWQRAGGVLLVVLAEHMLFEINNYMADLLALPLLLEATRLALRNAEEAEKPARQLARIAFLVGLSVTFKLTNLAVALPLTMVCAYDFVIKRRPGISEFFKATLLAVVAFLVPLLPVSLYLQQQTGSPVFPVLNGIFKSPYWPPNSGWDGRWGAVGFWETLLWPLRITSSPERLSELPVYSGRLSIGFVVALLALFVARRDPRLRTLCLITLAGLMLWSATTGYIRYALYLELLAGVVALALAAVVAEGRTRRLPSLLRAGLPALLWLALAVQAAFASRYVSHTEWSQRPTLLTHPGAWRDESRRLLRDRSLRDFLTADDRALFDGVEVWIDSSIKTNGIASLLNHRIPMIGLRNHENFVSPESKARFAAALERASGKRMYSLSFAEGLPAALEFIESRGLVAGRQTPLSIPFYAPQNRIPVVLIEVMQAETASSAARAAHGARGRHDSVTTFQIQ